MKILFLVILITMLGACGAYDCTRASAHLAFVAFPRNEVDTLLLRKFAKGSNFSNTVDTLILDSTKSNYWQHNDTLEVLFSFGRDIGLKSDFDYEVVLPSTGKKYQLSDIHEDFRSLHHGIFNMDKVGCVNFITSYKADGQLVSGKNNYEVFYFHK